MRLVTTITLCFCFQLGIGQPLKKLMVKNGLISYYSEGKGETIVFIHGGQEDFRVFMPQVELLHDRFQVVTYSRRYNFPNDNKINGDYSAKTETEDLRVLVTKLGKQVHLVGHSYGGLIALEFALSNPQMVKSLVLSEPALVKWLREMPDCITSYANVQKQLISETREAFATKDTTLVMKELFEFFAGADIQDKIPQEVLEGLKANLREMEALVNSPSGLDAPKLDDIKNLEMPIMILTSENTMPMLKCTNKKLLAIKPNAIHHHLINAGHEMWMTNQEELAAYISDFIR